MRHHPSCWNKVLAKLGFRRVSRRQKRQAAHWGRLSRIESLESRQLLAGDTYVVTTLSDVAVAGTTTDNLWSLREALAHAAADGQADKDIIHFGDLSGELSLSGQLTVNSDVDIVGPGADLLRIDAGGSTRVFSINSGVKATISGLKITGGGNVTEGGGVRNEGSLTLSGVAIVGNTATTSGGGVWSYGSGQLQILNSTIDDNRSTFGSGVYANTAGGSLKIDGSTVSNNRHRDGLSYSEAGGLYLAGTSAGSATITNSTFSGNRAHYSGGVRLRNDQSPLTVTNSTIAYNFGDEGGGVQFFANSVAPILHNTIVAENRNYGDTLDKDVSGTLTASSSYNLFGRGGAGGLTDNDANHNLVLTTGESAGLAPLGEFGGTTKTHALLPGSQAFDAGSDAVAAAAGVTTDQRGSTRTEGVGVADIGAYELSLIVSTLVDESDGDYSAGDLSLREALFLAAKQSANNEITFDSSLPSGTLTLGGSGSLIVTSEVEIIGPGAEKLTLDAHGASRVFSINAGVKATISGLKITGGGNVSEGGGILNAGDLTLQSVVVAGNTATVIGGGVQSVDWAGGTASLRIIDSTIDGNRSVTGSGVNAHVFDGRVLEIVGSTISNNIGLGIETSTYSAGGGLAIAGYAGGTVTIANSTFSGNRALNSGAIRLQNNNAATTIVNSTIAYNTGNGSGGLQRLNNTVAPVLHNTIVAENKDHSNVDKDIEGVVSASSSYNLIGRGGAGGLSDNDSNHNLVLTTGENAGLASLADNGGPTKTHAPLVGSPAVDKGADLYAPATDQRRHRRPMDLTGVGNDGANVTDIGAFEAGNPTVLTVKVLDDELDPGTIGNGPDLSLREALAYAATTAAVEVIEFDASLFTTLRTLELKAQYGPLEITSGVIIEGPGADWLTIDAHGESNVFKILTNPVSNTATIQGLKLIGASSFAVDTPGGLGGDVDVTLDQLEITGNAGGVQFLFGRKLDLSRSLVAENSGQAVLIVGADAPALIENTTISGNHTLFGRAGLVAQSSTPIIGRTKVIAAEVALELAASTRTLIVR